jgi:hypothetical protein
MAIESEANASRGGCITQRSIALENGCPDAGRQRFRTIQWPN